MSSLIISSRDINVYYEDIFISQLLLAIMAQAHEVGCSNITTHHHVLGEKAKIVSF